MTNKYSAQNIAAYCIYEVNELKSFINNEVLQYMLADVDAAWHKYFGQSAFTEEVAVSCDYTIKTVFDAYAELGEQHIEAPAKEWDLPYGTFQLVYRPFAVPAFTADEEHIVRNVIRHYRLFATQAV